MNDPNIIAARLAKEGHVIFHVAGGTHRIQVWEEGEWLLTSLVALEDDAAMKLAHYEWQNNRPCETLAGIHNNGTYVLYEVDKRTTDGDPVSLRMKHPPRAKDENNERTSESPER